MLMKVLIYMCPQNELVHILQHAPPILGISYLINIWNEKKYIKDDEVIFLFFMSDMMTIFRYMD